MKKIRNLTICLLFIASLVISGLNLSSSASTKIVNGKKVNSLAAWAGVDINNWEKYGYVNDKYNKSDDHYGLLATYVLGGTKQFNVVYDIGANNIDYVNAQIPYNDNRFYLDSFVTYANKPLNNSCQQKIKYKVADKSILSVNSKNGLVKIKKCGYTYITTTYKIPNTNKTLSIKQEVYVFPTVSEKYIELKDGEDVGDYNYLITKKMTSKMCKRLGNAGIVAGYNGKKGTKNITASNTKSKTYKCKGGVDIFKPYIIKNGKKLYVTDVTKYWSRFSWS